MQIRQVDETVKIIPETKRDVFDLGRISTNPDCETHWVAHLNGLDSHAELVELEIKINDLVDLLGQASIK